jgi:hypothetical protein
MEYQRRGTVRMTLRNGQTARLDGVLFMLDMSTNLISAHTLLGRGINQELTKNGYLLKRNGRVVARERDIGRTSLQDWMADTNSFNSFLPTFLTLRSNLRDIFLGVVISFVLADYGQRMTRRLCQCLAATMFISQLEQSIA